MSNTNKKEDEKMRKNKLQGKMLCLLVVLAMVLAPCAVFADVKPVVGEPIWSWYDVVNQMVAIDAACDDIELFTLEERYGPDCTSEAGRPLYVLKMGSGENIIWIQAQIHGNEKLTTVGFMEFIWQYAEDPAFRAQFEDLTIYAIPVYNPDGSIIGQRGTVIDPSRRIGALPNGTGSWTNYDLNRDWKANVRGEGYAFGAKESVAYYLLFCDIMPDFMLDLHHQGTKTTNGWPVTMTFGISLYVDGETLPFIKDYRAREMQMQKYVHDQILPDVQALFGYPNPNIDLYTAIDIYGGLTSAVPLGINYNGLNPYNHSCPAVFYENEQQNNGGIPHANLTARWANIARQNYYGVTSFCKAIISGDYLSVDPETYWNINYGASSRPAVISAGNRDWNPAIPLDVSNLSGVRAGIKTDAVSGIEGNVEYTLEVYGAENVLALELEFVVDGPLAGIGVEGVNGFEPMSDIFWTYAGSGTWKGAVTMKYEAGGESTGFSKPTKLADIAKFAFAPTAQGDATMELTGFRAVGLDGDTTHYLASRIAIPSATTTIEQLVWSKYDLNKDNTVDALDLGIMLLYVGFSADAAGWIDQVKVNDSRGRAVTASMCDVNGDGKIDMLDLLDLFIHYTK